MKNLALLLACLAALLTVRPAYAHPADLYYQVVTAHLSPGGADLTWDVLPGIILAQVAWTEADADHDSLVSAAEAEAWAESIAGGLQITLNGDPVPVRVESVEWPAALSDIQNNNVPIRIHLRADWPASSATRGLVIQDQYNSQTSVDWFYLYGEEGIKFKLPEQNGGTLNVLFGLLSDEADALTAWESGKPAIPGLVQALGLGQVAQQAAEQVPQKQGVSAILEGLMRSRESSPWFVFAALALAAVVGALHALTPGHGKTVVAAYLIGSRGTLKHAVFLGGVVTLTHTGSVFLLGLVALAASQYILPTSLFPILEILSGVLIVGLGASLLYQRVQAWMKHRSPVRGKVEILNMKGAGEHKRERSFVLREHTHDHVEGAHSHDHEHGHDHDHSIPDPSEINWRTLLALGVSGGLVPCPEAIAILLLAISIRRLLLGLSLILSFSLGLAFVLIAIGVILVQSKRLFARLKFIDRWAYAIPVASAAIVLVLGLALTVGAVNNARAASPIGPAAIAQPVFDIARARVIFSAPDDNKRNQLYVVSAMGGTPEPITDESQGVRDDSLSSDAVSLAYSASDGNGGTDLWKLDLRSLEKSKLLACPSALCTKLVWPHNGERALYSRLGLTAEEPSLGVPSIWWLDLATGETGPVFQDAQIPALNFDWSPDGRWLSYTSGVALEIRINNLADGASYTIPTVSGAHLAWSPAGNAFLISDLLNVTDSSRQVLRYEAGETEGKPLIGDAAYQEYDPAWSPDGEWIALVRSEARGSDQMWLVGPDGSDAHPVTAEADTLHGKPVWSPDGRYLLFTYSRVGDPLPRIQILEIATGKSWEVSSRGNQPAWLP